MYYIGKAPRKDDSVNENPPRANGDVAVLIPCYNEELALDFVVPSVPFHEFAHAIPHGRGGAESQIAG